MRAPRGLDSTLIKELKMIGVDKSVRKIPGRKAVEVRGGQDTMWKILYQSRICEDLQVKICSSFKARGESELRKNL
jgi:23S rRNA G2445 N2-methylase RlmL